ncbi:glycogen debranching enzyme family protein [Candidatus Saganbacteria bacterium]|uniref:Glycogen debranching enzyme family protein n=1 Tax=Candidatus Saganbacteria bacterium TaxID=2575572 RepID=A0A9D6UMB2_UNCSA|nr:glycogen debranching enzyme family protein [Candidatus Saganbacteria bacterium]
MNETITYFVGDFRSIEQALEKEWLIANGIGGFASGTILGVNTRRYHGLLIAAARPPAGRIHAVANLEEDFIVGKEIFPLSIQQYKGVFHPRGDRNFLSFSWRHWPQIEWRLGGARIVKSIVMPHGENATVTRYEFRDMPSGAGFRLRPLLTGRDFHCQSHENSNVRGTVFRDGDWDRIDLYEGISPLFLYFSGPPMTGDPVWHRNVFEKKEAERGMEAYEDYFSPGFWRVSLEAGDCDLYFKAAFGEAGEAPGEEVFTKEKLRMIRLTPAGLTAPGDAEENRAASLLCSAADGFIVDRKVGKDEGNRQNLKTILAGYPWFADWGRDAMIALPGLTLCTGRFEAAKEILAAFAHFCDRGMLPNRFPDGDEAPEYNTADAAMWFFFAAYKYLVYTQDWSFVRETLFPTMLEIVEWHVKGTRFGIRVDASDGLVAIGDSSSQLTWMDAKVNDVPVTPRAGKPVEINALWTFGLWFLEKISNKLNKPFCFSEIYSLASRSFEKTFWNDEKKCLFDVVRENSADASIRPNQIIALSLPISFVSREKAELVWNHVDRELYTPYGLRSLASDHPLYSARYEGGPANRDAAYHQGTVWLWPLGHHLTAFRNVFGRSEKTREETRRRLRPLWGHLADAGVGWLGEIFDAEPPHVPRGCIAQAWSVAEALRVYSEEVLGQAPQGKFEGLV